jgi:hypothetical protein
MSFMSADDDEDVTLKKQVANTNFGLLERHINKNHKSYIFDNYGEAKFYQARYGGTINYIKQYEEQTIHGDSALDNGIDGAGPNVPARSSLPRVKYCSS